MSADRCIGIDDILGMFVRALIRVVPLWTDEMVHDEIFETVEACEEEMVGLGFMESDHMIEVEDSQML